MAQFVTTAFRDTGFSSLNIPDSKALLNNAPFISLPSVWKLQDYDMASIRVETTWDEIKSVDYCRIEDAYYFVDNVIMLNVNTAELQLSLDAITTIGLNKIGVINGWCTRRHVNVDTPFSNTLTEPFSPLEVGVVDFADLSISSSPEITVEETLLGSTVSLDTIPEVAKTFTDAATGSTVTVPLVTPIEDSTIITLASLSGNKKRQLPNTALYLFYEEQWSSEIQILRSLGLDSALTCCYKVPIELIDSIIYPPSGSSQSSIQEIVSKVLTPSIPDNLNFRWSTVQNNKVYAGQYNQYTLYSLVSGDSMAFQAGQIYDGTSTKPTFKIFADLSPTGRTYCRPSIFEGNTGSSGSDTYIATVQGNNWQNTPILLTGSSGSAIQQIQYGYDSAGIALDRLQLQADNTFAGANIGTNLLSSLSRLDIGGAVGSVTGGAQTLYNNGLRGVRLNISELNKRIDFETGTRLVTPDIKFPQDLSLQSYVGNGFYLVRTRLSQADTQRFDRFLTMYGYATSEPMTTAVFSGRQYFNYVSCTDLNISVPAGIPLRVKNNAINALQSGVRIWHVKPDASYFNSNPIV